MPLVPEQSGIPGTERACDGHPPAILMDSTGQALERLEIKVDTLIKTVAALIVSLTEEDDDEGREISLEDGSPIGGERDQRQGL